MTDNFDHNISICSIIKNEGKELNEWLAYHLSIGVNHFYLYDNESTDNTKEILSHYNSVTYHYWDAPQPAMFSAFQHCVDNYKNETQWMAFIDADEFIQPMKGNLKDILKDYEDYSGLCINWMIYGSSWHDKRPKGGLLNNYMYRSNEEFEVNKHIKTIANPRLIVETTHPHYFKYTQGHAVTENKEKIELPWSKYYSGNIIRLNHYYCKSKEDYQAKIDRKKCDDINGFYDFSMFDEHDKNDVFDDSLANNQKKINLKVLFLQYDTEKNPSALHYLKRYLKLISIPYEIIVIDNKIDRNHKPAKKDNVTYIGGDNTLHEFTGWQCGINYLNENNINYDVILFVNDSFLSPGGYSDMSVTINDNSIKECFITNGMIGNMVGNEIIGKYCRTHCFLLPKKIIDHIKTLYTFDFKYLDECISKELQHPYFLPNAPLNKLFQQQLADHLSKYWHSRINILENWDIFRMKAFMLIQEVILTAKITMDETLLNNFKGEQHNG